MDQVEVAYTVGPIIIGVFLNALLYGVCVLQFNEYYTSGAKDRWWIRCLVHYVLVLDTYHTCSTVYLLWLYSVNNFGTFSVLSKAPWPFAQTPLITVCTTVPIQIFLSWRIKLFSNSWPVFIALVFFAVIQWAAGTVTAILSIRVPETAKWGMQLPVVVIWLGSAVVCDLSITALLVRYLRKRQHGSRQTNHVISLLMRSAVETACFGSFFCLLDLLTFSLFRQTNIYLIFTLPLGRIYTNTLLTTLNNRAWLRSELQIRAEDSDATSWMPSQKTSPLTHISFQVPSSPPPSALGTHFSRSYYEIERRREREVELGSIRFVSAEEIEAQMTNGRYQLPEDIELSARSRM